MALYENSVALAGWLSWSSAPKSGEFDPRGREFDPRGQGVFFARQPCPCFSCPFFFPLKIFLNILKWIFRESETSI